MAPKVVTKEEYYRTFNERAGVPISIDPVVPVTFRGNQYLFELDNKALKDIMVDTKINILGEGVDSSVLDTPEILGSFVHRLLQRHHNLTLAETDALIEFRKFIYLRSRILLSLELFLPDMTDIERPTKVEDMEDRPQ